MRGVIIKESEILNNIENKHILSNKPSNDINILVKKEILNLLKDNENINDVISKNKSNIILSVGEKIKACIPVYKPSQWEKRIEQSLMYIKNNMNGIVDIDNIYIYESEWENIIGLNDRILERIAFILLVYQKINEIKYKSNNGWVNNTLTDIFNEAKVGYTGKEQKLLLNKLYNLKYIKQKNTVDATQVYINYRELIDEDKKVKITIDNFENVITYYYEFRDGVKYKNCEVCGKRIKITNNRIKYCSRCRKEINIQKTLENKKV